MVPRQTSELMLGTLEFIWADMILSRTFFCVFVTTELKGKWMEVEVS